MAVVGDDTKVAGEVEIVLSTWRRPRIDRSDETVSSARQCFEVSGCDALVPQRRPELLDTGIQAVVEADKGSIGPENIAQVLARHDLASMLDQVLQQCAWLRTQAQTTAPATQFAASRVEHELPEVIHASRHSAHGVPALVTLGVRSSL